MRARRLRLLLFAVVGLLPGKTRANGAFPDSLGILLPLDQPNRILASTNFGLLVSEDEGTTWQWVCEQAAGNLAFLYALGPPPADRIYAVSQDGLTFSSDFGCTWAKAGGRLSDRSVTDVFPDPTDSQHVFATVRVSSSDAGVTAPGVYESHDSGRSFVGPLFEGPAFSFLTSVESARSDPRTIYLTFYDSQARPSLARSTDAGQTWQRIDLEPVIGPQTDPRLLAVDPVDAKKLYFRLTDLVTGKDRLGISTNSGDSIRVLFELQDRMTAFLRRSDGALLVGQANGTASISTDGQTFASWPSAPHLRALGERNGALYAVADNYVDGYAVGVSRDQGASWRPLVRFEQLQGPKQCGNLPALCAAPWEALRARLGLSGDAGIVPPARGGSCGCVADGSSSSAAVLGTVLFVLIAIGALAAHHRSGS